MNGKINSVTELVASVLDDKKWGRLMAIITKFCSSLENDLADLPDSRTTAEDAIGALEKQITVICRDFCSLEPVFQMIDGCIYLLHGPRYLIHVEILTVDELEYLRRLIAETKTEDADDEFGYTQLYWSIPIKYQLTNSQRIAVALAGCSYLLANARMFCATRKNELEIHVSNFNLHFCDRILRLADSTTFAKSLSSECATAVITGIKGLALKEKQRVVRSLEQKLANEFEFD